MSNVWILKVKKDKQTLKAECVCLLRNKYPAGGWEIKKKVYSFKGKKQWPFLNDSADFDLVTV